MRTMITATAISLLALAPAGAADFGFPVKASPVVGGYNWSGGYIGGHIGYGLDLDAASDNSRSGPSAPFQGLLAPGGTNLSTGSDFRSRFEGVLGGPQAGYNFQFGSWVLGAEADISFGRMSKRRATSSNTLIAGALTPDGALAFGLNPGDIVSFNVNETVTARHSIGTFGTIRGRFGFAFDRYLVYATGGLVIADQNANLSFTTTGTFSPNLAPGLVNATFAGTASTSKIAFGATVGGGIEAMISSNWSVKAEYLYLRLPSQTISATSGGGNTRTETFNSDFHIARAGINYHF
jgi:outer membrane immunogenic protein